MDWAELCDGKYYILLGKVIYSVYHSNLNQVNISYELLKGLLWTYLFSKALWSISHHTIRSSIEVIL